MGTYFWPMEVSSPDGSRWETVEALVDTGSSYSVFPSSMLYRLGIVPLSRRRFVQADGSVVLRETRIVAFGGDDLPPRLGADTLQGVLLSVYPVAERLVPTDALLL